jgi:probable rRNA maturation factor
LSTPDPLKYEIEIVDDQQHLPIDADWLRDVVEGTLKLEQVHSAEISVAIIDNERIQPLNREFLQHDYATDVLSFLLECETVDPNQRDGTSLPLGAGKRISGEVVVSADMAIERAAEFDWSPREELVLYVIHGLLHLCGYDDHNDEDRKTMRSRETEVLQSWNITPHDTVPDVNQSE